MSTAPGRPPGEHEAGGHVFRDDEAEPAPAPAPPRRRITWQKLVLLPAVVAVVLLIAFVWITNVQLDSIAKNSSTTAMCSSGSGST